MLFESSEEEALPFVARGSLSWLHSPGKVLVPHAGDPHWPHHAQSRSRFRDSVFSRSRWVGVSKVSAERRWEDGRHGACKGREEVSGCAIPSPRHLSPGIKAKGSNPTVDGVGNLLQHGLTLVVNQLKSCLASFISMNQPILMY